ncbi:MAG TPA: NAD(P)H-dependent oxidoreductase [Candidatus Aphodomonas merdavium]|nr:NAD(P)H-dependent oxidoreductase [Candidatus Aphodomonas merdavium]
MEKKLVAYFSASGVTAKVAASLAQLAGADLYEIRPQTPYTPEDLDWRNKRSRSSLEMSDPASRPPIEGRLESMQEYGVIFLGFPIWWYVAPTIINTFLESYDLSGKTIVPFATSGSSGMGETNAHLQPSCPHSKLLPGKRFSASPTSQEISAWLKSLAL